MAFDRPEKQAGDEAAPARYKPVLGLSDEPVNP